ncbi:MAG: amidohydrolase family protein [Gemmatimonadota bacterium]
MTKTRAHVAALLLTVGCTTGRPVAADLVIENVTLIDGTDHAPRPGMSVAVKDGKVVAVEEAGPLRVSSGATMVDGRGKYLIPGLADMHVHLSKAPENDFALFLANGVTTIRDMGGGLATSLRLRDAMRSGRILGPEVLIAGPTLDAEYVVRVVRNPSKEPTRESVPDSATAVMIVDSLARMGVDHIKVHSMMPRAAYFAVLAEAKKRGVFVVGHIPDSVTATEAIEAGQRTLEHNVEVAEAESGRGAEITRWMLAAMQRVMDSSTESEVVAVYEVRTAAADSALRSYDPAVASAFAELAAKRDVWFDPTLVVREARIRINDPEYLNRPELIFLPRAVKMDNTSPNPPASIAEADRQWQNVLLTMRPLVQAGAKFLAGTDVPVVPLVPGFSLQRELGLLVEGGLSPLQALQAATRNAAAAAGKLAEAGTIEPGKRADLVLLDADPLADIGNTRRIRAVVTRGRLLDRDRLDGLLRAAEVFAAEARKQAH